jgi:xylulokinase
VRDGYLLGIDCGTQSAKAGLWSLGGEAAGRGACSLEVSSPHPGWAEQDPREWWRSTCTAIRAACVEVDPGKVTAVGVAWQRESFTLVDMLRQPVRPGILWLDIRAGAEVGELADYAAGLHAETGKPVDVTVSLPRIAWLRKHEPELFGQQVSWADVGCRLFEALVGRRATCVAGADTAGMIGLASRAWSPAALARAGLEAQDVPELVEPGAVVGGLTEEAAQETGLRPGTPVIAAGGDGQVFASAAIGGDPDGSSLTLGTSVVLGIPAREPSVSPLYRTLFAALPDRSYLLEAVIQSGTYLLTWLEALLGSSRGAGLGAWEAEARALPPGAEGLVTVPHWWGTRFPRAAPDARGATLGWSNHHTRAHLYRSVLEGVAFELRSYREAIAGGAPGLARSRLTVGGGGARSGLWRAIIRDVLGVELAVVEEPEPVALGAAILAAVGAAEVSGFPEAHRRFVRPGPASMPDARARGRYERLYSEVYVPLRRSAVELSARLAGASLEA